MSHSFHPNDYPIVLFDSQCLICNGFIRWLIRNDPKGKFKFSGLQSDKAQSEITRRNIPVPEQGTVILLFHERYLVESNAVIKILEILGFPGFITRLLMRIPSSWRDALYRFIAKNRYLFFNKRTYCRLPDPSDRKRFV